MADAHPELLHQGREPRRSRVRARHPHHRRRRVLLVVVLLVVSGVLFLVDHRVRSRESVQVAGCVSAATGSVRYASGRLLSVVSYVRPSLDSTTDTTLRRRLYRLVGEALPVVFPDLRRSLDRCERTRVLVVHSRLRSVRSDCVRLLEGELGLLRSIERDGSRADAARPTPSGLCRAP